jgi:hypothetical protein
METYIYVYILYSILQEGKNRLYENNLGAFLLKYKGDINMELEKTVNGNYILKITECQKIILLRNDDLRYDELIEAYNLIVQELKNRHILY